MQDFMSPNNFVLNSWQRTQLALELLVQNCLSANMPASNFQSPKAFLKEMITVRLASHRGAGHTESALVVAYKYFQRPAFIAITHDQAEIIAYRNENFKRSIKDGYVATHRNFDGLRGRDPDCIVVELASFLSQSRAEALFDLAATFRSLRCLILLQ